MAKELAFSPHTEEAHARTRTFSATGAKLKKDSAGEAIETNEKRSTHLSESSEVGLRFEEARVGLHART